MINRENIYAALFALVSSAAGLRTSTRLLKHWSDVAPSDQPALFQAQGRQNAVAGYRMPTKWTLSASLYVYTHQASLDKLPSVALNELVDAIEAKLAPGPDGEQTLGGLVSHCRIVGEIETDEGVLGEQAVAIIPIEIVAA